MTILIPLGGKTINGDQLTNELNAAGASLSPPMVVTMVSISGTDLQIAGTNLNTGVCQQVLAAHVPAIVKVPRPLVAIHADLLSLQPAQQQAIENYLKAVVNGQARWKVGNADVWGQMPAILGLTGNAKAQALAIAAANYALQFPQAFVLNSAIDNPPTINIPGDMPAS